MDRWLLRFAVAHRTQIMNHTALRVAHWGSTAAFELFVLAIVGVYAVRVRRLLMVPTVAAAALAGTGAADVLKLIVQRPRPPYPYWLTHASGYSMPSSVAAITAAAVVATFLCLAPGERMLRRLVGWGGGFLAFLAGGAVVYVGVHWPTDVIAGWVVGVVAAMAVARGFRQLDRLYVGPRYPNLVTWPVGPTP